MSFDFGNSPQLTSSMSQLIILMFFCMSNQKSEKDLKVKRNPITNAIYIRLCFLSMSREKMRNPGLNNWWWRWANLTYFFQLLLEVFDVDHWNLKGAAVALIFLVLGLANTIVGLMETWLEKNINFSSSTRQCFLVLLLEKSWLEIHENREDVKKQLKKTPKTVVCFPTSK